MGDESVYLFYYCYTLYQKSEQRLFRGVQYITVGSQYSHKIEVNPAVFSVSFDWQPWTSAVSLETVQYSSVDCLSLYTGIDLLHIGATWHRMDLQTVLRIFSSVPLGSDVFGKRFGSAATDLVASPAWYLNVIRLTWILSYICLPRY